MPPIVINSVIKDVTTFTNKIKKECSSSVRFKFNKTISVFTNTKADRKNVTNLFKLLEIPHHTYSFEEDRPRHLALRGLPLVDIMDIENELKINNLVSKQIRQMKKKPSDATSSINTSIYFPLYMVTLNNQEEVS